MSLSNAPCERRARSEIMPSTSDDHAVEDLRSGLQALLCDHRPDEAHGPQFGRRKICYTIW